MEFKDIAQLRKVNQIAINAYKDLLSDKRYKGNIVKTNYIAVETGNDNNEVISYRACYFGCYAMGKSQKGVDHFKSLNEVYADELVDDDAGVVIPKEIIDSFDCPEYADIVHKLKLKTDHRGNIDFGGIAMHLNDDAKLSVDIISNILDKLLDHAERVLAV